MARITFITKDGTRIETEARPGENVMEVGRNAGSLLEGTCEGSIACATCHVAVCEPWLERLPPASEDELEMLDCIPTISRLSRLGCQIQVTEELDGMELKIP